MSALRILLLEDNSSDAELIQELLEEAQFMCEVTRVQTRPEFRAALENVEIDLILADYKLPSFDGLSALHVARSVRPDLPFIFVSGTLGEEVAIEALKVGATDYVLKTRLSRLVPSVQRALRETQERAERKKAEAAMRQLEADLAHMNRVNMMGELSASLAHEIKQPIAAAVTGAQACMRWLRRDVPDLAEACEAASALVAATTRAAEVIDQMRLLYLRGTPKQESVQLNEVIREMTGLLRDTANRSSVSIRTELDLGLPTTTADRVQLQQVLMNLMLNGIEAMKDGGGDLIVVSKTVEDDQLVVSVRDSGIGLPVAERERIFEAFFTTKPQGIGMGLSISRRIIQAHGGHLWATPNTGLGATFHFTLPAT
jgi:C4-dicarboxylate-specific signal transduction histidine kinase